MPSIALSRSNFPFLTRTDWRTSIQWNHGEMYSSLLSTSFVRVSERGIWWCVTVSCPQTAFDRVSCASSRARKCSFRQRCGCFRRQTRPPILASCGPHGEWLPRRRVQQVRCLQWQLQLRRVSVRPRAQPARLCVLPPAESSLLTSAEACCLE